MRKRRLKVTGLVLLVIFGLPLVLLLFERFRGQVALARFKKELIAKGEKTSPQDFVRDFKPEENGAPAFKAAKEKIVTGAVLPLGHPPAARVLPSGRAVVGFREPAWIESGSYESGEWTDKAATNHWEDVASDLNANSEALAAVVAAVKYPSFDNKLNFATPLEVQFTHLAPPKSMLPWFGSRVQSNLRAGELTEARNDLLTMISLLRVLADDHLAISELVRIAMAAIARQYTWEALQAEGWSDDALAAVQAAWTEQSFAPNMAHALEGERVFISHSYQAMRVSNDTTHDMLFSPWTEFLFNETAADNDGTGFLEFLPWGEEIVGFGRRQIYCRLWRFAWSHQAELRTLRHVSELIDIARSAEHNRSQQTVQSDVDSLIAEIEDKNIYDRLRFPSPDSVVTLAYTIKRSTRAETDRAMVITAISLKRFHLRHGNYPQKLDALVPEFLPAVPTDYMDGKPIKYRLNEDGSFTLYSVGQDGEDNGGDLALPEGSRTRDLWQRRDYVWPLPATPEEVEEYRREASKDADAKNE